MINVIIVDDHMLIREGFCKIIDRVPDISVVGEASSKAELFSILERTDCNLIVLDIKLGKESGLELLKELNSEKPDLPVLMLSMFSEHKFAVRTIKAGASGYLTKDRAPEELVQAIRKVHSGEKYVTPELAEELFTSLSAGNGNPHSSLSDREYQVFLKIAEGEQSHIIAEDLNLSKNTIQTYRQRILEKMNMRTNSELIKYAIQHNLVD